MTTTRDDDSGLDLPLHGVRLIEASAGTGKTFVLATLFVRLVVERKLRIGQILAVTFTDAATQELRKRIRERLELAASIVGTDGDDSDNAEIRLTRQIIARHLESQERELPDDAETAAGLQRRLRTAALEIDLASIFTIHGFCARVLREHALESGHAFTVPELLGSERELLDELAVDLWRVHAADVADAEDLATLWSSPDALASDLSGLLRQRVLVPMPAAEDAVAYAQARNAVDHSAQALRAAIDQYLDAARALIAAAFDRKTFDGRRARRPSFDKAFQSLQEGYARGDWSFETTGHLEKLLPQKLVEFCKSGAERDVPVCAVFTALEDWRVVAEQLRQFDEQRRLRLLHRIRDEARERLAATKRARRVQTFDDQIDGVAEALHGPQAAQLLRNLRRQYAVALADEFQDTDERQWGIFRTLFGDSEEARSEGLEPALFLIGDPKQAIYGFRGGDVHTYLAAKADADPAPPLAHNFRSRPGVLRAIDTLYEVAGKQMAFLVDGIEFEDVQPGGKRKDTDFIRNGGNAPALTVRVIAADAGKLNKQGLLNADDSRIAATAACVAAIHGVLSEARAGTALIDGRPVQPGDIAVLVRNHKEATRIRQALALAGIPAVAAGRQSLFATDEAHDLSALLQALLLPADPGRLRALLATVMLGESAASIAALDTDTAQLHERQRALVQWRDRLLHGGPFALVSDLCAANAQRLMGLLDGERRLSNYLQLGEQLQDAATQALGLRDLSDWLQRRITEADANDETQQLRLESDAHRVQIVTLHKSKGLEYPLVFLPYAGIGRDAKSPSRGCVVYREGAGRELHWKLGDPADWDNAVQAWKQEQRAEDARLLYVGLTRAEHALWIATGPFFGAGSTPLTAMLEKMEALRACADVAIVEAPAEPPPARLPPEAEAAVLPAREVRRELSRDWWVYSFSQLSKADAGESATSGAIDESPVADEPAQDVVDLAAAPDEPVAARDFRFAGTRFGSALHDALERVDFAAWSGWKLGDASPAGEEPVLREALRGRGFADADIDDGVTELVPLVGKSLTAVLPEGVRLCDVPANQRRAEIEFHFSLRPVQVRALLQLLHGHGVVSDRTGFGTRRQLEGLMNGKVDLTYFHDGRCHVLDYKSNHLPDYGDAALERAMRDSEYDLQALIYTLALHRWLRFRRGDAYDYERDFGGIRYLFCRGLDPARADAPGVHARKFGAELVEALDQLFAGETPVAARGAA